jgi:F420-dependent oxidoreductase-like protein
MTAGVVIRTNPSADNTVDDALWQARTAADYGVQRVWFGQRYDLDALMLAAVVGTAVPGLRVGTAIVPINPRHPLLIASAAQTAQAASHGNFSLGIGLGGNDIERRSFGLTAGKQMTRLREYLTVLNAIFCRGSVDFDGLEISAHTELSPVVPGGRPIPTYVAAMGPKALEVAGGGADGTITYLAGPRTIAELIRPTLDAAAAEAGRPAPAIIASIPVAVTSDLEHAREAAATSLNFYDQFSSYQKVVAREGLQHAADLAILGDEDHVAEQVGRYRDAGATDIILSPVDPSRDALAAMWQLAAQL